MKKYVRLFAGLAACAVILTGCGSAKLPEVIDTTTISIDKEEVVTSYLVDEFNKEYYDVSELASMAVKDAAAYNEEHRDDDTIPLRVETVELLGNGDKVMVQHVYDEDETYAEYNECVFYYGSVEDALEEGFEMSAVSLNSVKDGTVTNNWISGASDKHILITDQKAQIYCPYKVTHISNGAVYNENGSVDTSQAEGLVYILLKK